QPNALQPMTEDALLQALNIDNDVGQLRHVPPTFPRSRKPRDYSAATSAWDIGGLQPLLHGITADPRPLQGSASYLPSPFEFLVQHHEAPHVAYDFGAVGPGKGPQRLREIRLVRLAEC